MPNSAYFITTFYKFIPIASLDSTKAFFQQCADQRKVKGLIVLAPEGFNSTVSAKTECDLESFKNDLLKHFKLSELNFKDSDESARISSYTWICSVHSVENESHDVSGKCQNFLDSN